MMLNIVHQRFCKVNKSILWHSSWCNISLLLPAELVPCSSYWKCNYPTTNPQTLKSICWSVVGRSVIIPKNGRKVRTPCFYRSTCSVYGYSDYMRPMICKKKVKEILIKCQVNYRILKCSYFHLFRKQLFDGKGLCLSLKAVIIKAAVLIQPSWNGGSFFRNQWKTYIEMGILGMSAQLIYHLHLLSLLNILGSLRELTFFSLLYFWREQYALRELTIR